MTTFTTPKTWSAATLTSSELNTHVRDNEKNLDERLTLIGQTSASTLGQIKAAAYGCVVRRTSTQSISDTTSTAVLFPTADMTEELDSDGFHSGASNTARLTVPAGGGGWYDIGADVQFQADVDGRRNVWEGRHRHRRPRGSPGCHTGKPGRGQHLRLHPARSGRLRHAQRLPQRGRGHRHPSSGRVLDPLLGDAPLRRLALTRAAPPAPALPAAQQVERGGVSVCPSG